MSHSSKHKTVSISLSKTESALYSKQINLPPTSCPNKCKKCVIIKRLLLGLKHFTSAKEIIRHFKFMDQVYKKHVYDDYYHLTKCHEKELKSIKTLATKSYKLTKCKLSTCQFSNRHYRVDREDKDIKPRTNHNNKTIKYDIYLETMDSLHFYLFHLMDTGMRQNVETKIDESEDEKQEQNAQLRIEYNSIIQ